MVPNFSAASDQPDCYKYMPFKINCFSYHVDDCFAAIPWPATKTWWLFHHAKNLEGLLDRTR